MLFNIRDTIINIYKNDTKRFCVAQILFIASISFGWFLADGYRRGLFLLAILLLNKSQRKIDVMRYWKGLVRIGGLILIALFLWVTLIPLFFSVEPFGERILGMARPIEAFLYCVGVMIFAKDDFFTKNLCSFSIVSAMFISLFAFTRRLLLSFSAIRDDWVFGMHAALAGLILSSLLPWIFYAICSKNTDRHRRIFYIIALFLSLTAIFVTYYRTIWLAVIAQIIVAVPLSYYCFNANLLNHKKLLVTMIILVTIVFTYSYHVSYTVRSNIERSMYICSDFETFTSRRGEIWEEAISLISKRKLGGYGWVSYDDFAVIKKHHPHSSYLEAAFHAGIPAAILYCAALLVFFLLALRYIFTKTKPCSIPYVVSLMILASAIAGFTEAFFFVSREYLIPFWSMVSILISPLFVKRKLEVYYDE